MKGIIFVFLLVGHLASAQSGKQEKCLYVKYKDKDDNNFLINQWFFSDRTIFSNSYAAIPKLEFPNASSGETSLDSIQQQEILAGAQKQLEQTMRSTKMSVTLRYFNSSVLHKSLYDLKGKKYYVLDTLMGGYEWQIVGDTSTVLGFICQKAKAKLGNYEYEAWFASDFPVAGGPKNVRGLPGIVLMLSCAAIDFKIEAIEVQFPSKVNLPDLNFDGKRISKSEYNKIIEEQNKEALQSIPFKN